MPKITNPHYKNFVEQGLIELKTKEDLDQWINKIPTQKWPRKCTKEQAISLMIMVFYSGRRPSEIANLKAEDANKLKNKSQYYITLKYKTLKGGVTNTIWLPYNKHTKYMYKYIKNRPPQMFAFWSFRSSTNNPVKWTTERDIIVKENGKIHKERYKEQKKKTYIRHGDKIKYYVNLWTGYPAYYFRHNRYSTMYANGATDSEVQLFKGAKNPASVNMYKHMSQRMAKNITKYF